MPKYESGIPQDGVDSTQQAATAMNEVAQRIDQMNQKMARMTDLFKKVRDYTQEELSEINEYRRSISSVADEYKRLHGNSVKGMNDYSIAIKAVEDRVKSLLEMERKASEELKQFKEKASKIEAAQGLKNKKERHAAMKEALGVEKANAVEINKIRDREKTRLKEEIDQRKQLLPHLQKEKEQGLKVLEIAEKHKKHVEDRVQEERRRRGRGDLFEMASDLHLPGVSHAATMAKYARRGADDVGEEAGSLARLGGGLKGGLLGAGIVAGGYTMLQGYRTYNTAHQMAPMGRTLGGQMGAESVGARQSAVQAYGGYGGLENLQALIQLNRQLGGKNGLSNLKGVTDISNAFGMSRDEAIGQAGALFQAGGASPGKAGESLKDIMIEGVKGGMDRARITEFTKEVVRIQEGVFKMTGQNNAQMISESLAQLMRASGQGEKFLHGPGMQAVMGMDSAVRQAGRGGGGQGAGTLYRAFGFGSAQGGQDYYNARKTMEGGIFTGAGAVNNIQKIFKQYDLESGRDAKTANLRIADEMGIGINQVEKLRDIQSRAATGSMTKDDSKFLQKMQEEAKDPMTRLLDINAKQNELLASLAGSDKGLGAIINIETALLKAQEGAVSLLEKIANILSGGEGAVKDAAGLAAGGLGAYGLYKGAGAVLGKGGGVAGMGLAAKAGLVGAAGYGGYKLGEFIDEKTGIGEYVQKGYSGISKMFGGDGIMSDEEAFAKGSKMVRPRTGVMPKTTTPATSSTPATPPAPVQTVKGNQGTGDPVDKLVRALNENTDATMRNTMSGGSGVRGAFR